jgi:hypothetical protein
LDAIAISIDSLQLAYARLCSSALTRDPEGEAHYAHNAAIVVDAWTMVDAAHRLLDLVMGMPGLSQKAPAVRVIAQDLEDVDALRNAVQHLTGERVVLVHPGRSGPTWLPGRGRRYRVPGSVVIH